MINRRRAFHHHIIDICFHILTQLFMKDLIHHPLICCPHIFLPEWHHLVAIQPLVGYKSSFVLVGLEHLYLVVAGKYCWDSECPNPVNAQAAERP
jgi:hypothetical protein